MARVANIAADGNALISVAHQTGNFFTLPSDSNVSEAVKEIATRSGANTNGFYPLHQMFSSTDRKHLYPIRDNEERLIGGVVQYHRPRSGQEKSVVVYATDRDVLAKFEKAYNEFAQENPTKLNPARER